MSSPSEPEEMVSTSIERSFLPSFITEPLPNWRSIWESAAASAFDLSIEEPSTIRRAGTDMGGAPYGGIRGRDNSENQGSENREPLVVGVCTIFVLCSQYVLFRNGRVDLFFAAAAGLKLTSA